MAGANVSLDTGSERALAAEAAGTNYVTQMEDIRNALVGDQKTGTDLSKLVKSQIELTTTETEYQVAVGTPTKAAKAALDAAKGVKSA